MRIGHASGGDAAGIPGDQTGREVRIQDWYGGAWDYVLRAKDDAAAEKMARFCEAVCANDHVGYSQATRNTLRESARAAGWDGSKINVDCNCDCSSFMSVCAEAAGVDMSKAYTYGNAPWTGIQREKFLATGAFDAFRYYASGAGFLRRGDILLDEDRHTIMVLDDGPRVVRETAGEGQGEHEKEDENVTRYNTVEEIPAWGRDTVLALCAAGVLRGRGWGTDADGCPTGLDLSEDMLRILVMLDRAGAL